MKMRDYEVEIKANNKLIYKKSQSDIKTIFVISPESKLYIYEKKEANLIILVFSLMLLQLELEKYN